MTRQERKQLRWLRRETKARQYRMVALAGGGKREVARRSGATWRAKRALIARYPLPGLDDAGVQAFTRGAAA